MTTAFAPAVESRPFDESKHVHYTLGMLLGVDDFNQEFAYLSGRDRRLARDAFGYGTVSGLRVALENDPSQGVRVSVTSGIAITPRGQMVCVRPSQCAYLNDWLAANARDLDLATFPRNLGLSVVLCYRDTPTDNVPFPGAACRTDDELMVPSRLCDSFQLELRLTPPKQLEEDKLAEFMRWLGAIPQRSGANLDDLQAAIRSSIVAPLDAARDPSEAVFGAPPATLTMPIRRYPEALRLAMRMWATEVRPRLHSLCAGGSGGCCAGGGKDAPQPDECLLLAQITVPVEKTGTRLTVPASAAAVVPDEANRPFVLHARMLQELILGGRNETYRVVAAGIVGQGAPRTLGNPTFTAPADGKVLLRFDAFDERLPYVVKAMPVNAGAGNPVVAFERISTAGITLNVTRDGALLPVAQLATMQFMIEVNQA